MSRARPRVRRTLVILAVTAATMTMGMAVPPSPVGADAGADLGLSVPSGPPGTVVLVRSPDLFDMDADQCPGVAVDPQVAEGDRYEVRWELGLLSPGASVQAPTSDAGVLFTTRADPVLEVLDSGSVATEPHVAWSATITVPDGVAPGDALVVNAECWRLGDDVPGGEELFFAYYYLQVFTVTGPAGSVPTSSTPGSEPADTTAPGPGTGGPFTPAPPASPRPGSPAFTG